VIGYGFSYVDDGAGSTGGGAVAVEVEGVDCVVRREEVPDEGGMGG